MWRRAVAIYDTIIILLSWGFFSLMVALLLARDVYVPTTTEERVHAYLRGVGFDFVGWTFGAVGVKLRQASLDDQSYLNSDDRSDVVRHYFRWRAQLNGIERDIAARYADPTLADPAAATADQRAQQADLRAQMAQLQPVAEALLQEQISVILAEQGLAVGGQPFPPVSFHLTSLPLALIVSPRDVIRQDVNTDVNGDLTLDGQVALEEKMEKGLDVSALLVPLGGIGTYPTMVGHSSDLNWIASVTAHEWTHNYLTLRPLGLNYSTTPELRTMNETTAEMVGSEIGALVIERYYPELVPPPAPFFNFLDRNLSPARAQSAPTFDFRAEMHATRVHVDELLASGKIEEAEVYMEERRRFLWDHGYQIRKLNQAYFAFYGAYAEAGGGAGGVDPVGPAVLLLRRRSQSTQAFLDTMAGFSSFEELQRYLGLK